MALHYGTHYRALFTFALLIWTIIGSACVFCFVSLPIWTIYGLPACPSVCVLSLLVFFFFPFFFLREVRDKGYRSRVVYLGVQGPPSKFLMSQIKLYDVAVVIISPDDPRVYVTWVRIENGQVRWAGVLRKRPLSRVEFPVMVSRLDHHQTVGRSVSQFTLKFWLGHDSLNFFFLSIHLQGP